MTLSKALQQRQPADSLGKISFWFSLDVDDDAANDWMVETIYSKLSQYSQTLSFSGKMPARTLLNARMWEILRNVLDTCKTTEAQSDGNFSAELPGLSLQSLQVVGFHHENARLRVMVVFHKTFGSMAQMFAPGKVPSPLESAQNDIATRILEDLIRPTLDLCNLPQEALRMASADTLERRLEALMGKRDDLDFYATLLTRFVAQQAEIGASHEHTFTEPANVPDMPYLSTNKRY